MSTLPAHVRSWACDVAKALRDHQRRDPFSRTANGHVVTPEQEAVEFFVRTLAEGTMPGTTAVIEWVDMRRAGYEEAA